MADLFFSDHLPTVGEIEAVDAALGPDAAVVAEPHPRVVRAGTRRRAQARHLLLPALHALNNHAGWISPGGLNHVCRVLQVPPAEAYGVATFYEMFRTTEPAHDLPVTHVCIDAACQIAGSQALLDELTAAGTPVHPSPCLGQCERAPAVFVQGRQSPDHVPADSNSYSIPQQDSPHLRLLRRVGVVDPTSIDSYIAAGGFQAYEEALALGPERLIELVRASGLSGRGGAAFPTAVKWSAVRQEVEAGRRAHVIANADESEPGTFKDRVLMELDPFSVVESLMIAALATGASKGWIYVRGEYPLATQRLAGAVQQCRLAGRLGDSFDIEIRRGAGAYICGEETAL
ncbi:MAG: NAD(P)H-dependent oxidoreductase subunit E, partial [Acidimicrobiales bacterium]|nr:NAD(P)H-dependent oxidoreductase subunit E [Acidimicrobiales bacterium]